MERELEKDMFSLFSRTAGELTLCANEEIEKEIVLDGKKRSADFYSFSLSGSFLSVKMKEIYVHKTVFKMEESVKKYYINDHECSPFSALSVLQVLKKSGYDVKQSLLEQQNDNFPIESMKIRRNEEGIKLYLAAVSRCGLKCIILTLEKKEDGSYYINAFPSSLIPFDASPYKEVFLGIDSLSEHVDRDIRKALIRYLDSLNNITLACGLQKTDIITYMSFLEKMEQSRAPFTFSLEINKSKEKDYFVTPLDFSYYPGFFQDTDEQRARFFDYYDAQGESEEKEKDRAYYLSVLGLDESATKEDIRNAWRILSKRFHPDGISSLNLDKAFLDFAQQRMSEINEAYEKLK
ncbi:MAG TPA: DnaJ domain-containing protein [Candidatus Ornithospirochaeta avicola]|uniref:DnaJ domain-containing protein n=1 Tax=Candidatus Ornithospirochaeta avicola TaxID=2840896 RepID=A0A9D1TML9_9SPIO|nr:DnaJ domain-containing protein [Candidatus Ornithospirochaeta avicola]